VTSTIDNRRSTMNDALNRRDVLETVGGAGLAAVFGVRAMQFLGEDAEAATTCLLTPEATATRRTRVTASTARLAARGRS